MKFDKTVFCSIKFYEPHQSNRRFQNWDIFTKQIEIKTQHWKIKHSLLFFINLLFFYPFDNFSPVQFLANSWWVSLYLHSSLLSVFGLNATSTIDSYLLPINLWKVCIDLRPFSKYFNEPFSRTLRWPRSNNLEIQNDKNCKWKLVKTRWNPKFGLSDLENDLLTSTTSEGAQWI